MAFSPDDKRVLTARGDRIVGLYDAGVRRSEPGSPRSYGHRRVPGLLPDGGAWLYSAPRRPSSGGDNRPKVGVAQNIKKRDSSGSRRREPDDPVGRRHAHGHAWFGECPPRDSRPPNGRDVKVMPRQHGGAKRGTMFGTCRRSVGRPEPDGCHRRHRREAMVVERRQGGGRFPGFRRFGHGHRRFARQEVHSRCRPNGVAGEPAAKVEISTWAAPVHGRYWGSRGLPG